MAKRPKKDLVCECGHNKKDHQYPGANKWIDSWCAPCGMNNADYWPLCFRFVADNLKYLESLHGKTL